MHVAIFLACSLFFAWANSAPSEPTLSLASYFPPASVVGNAGPTPTGNEPFEVATAPAAPYQTGYFPLVPAQPANATTPFNPVDYFGNLSPMVSLPPTTFSANFANSSALIPPTCTLNQVHLLHRHEVGLHLHKTGARYPTSGSDLQVFGTELQSAFGKVLTSGPLAFLNNWTYGLGAEILTPFGRQELFDMGVAFRIKYGHLLSAFPNGTLPVFRTTSNDRMVMSALNFAAGFFGIPYEDQYYEEIIIESGTSNNTLAPICLNADGILGSGGSNASSQWITTYLSGTATRLSALSGANFSPGDAFLMQQLCAYETVAVGYSDFCPLFTEEEFMGFEYAIDLDFWYSLSFGAPTAAASGIGWVQELVSRLTQTPISEYNSTTNSTLDGSSVTFPLNQPIYVDASHDSVISEILVALNFTSIASTGALPTNQIPTNRSFITSQFVPFATQLVAQVLTCGDTGGTSIRWLLNDASVPITNIPGCGADPYGRCSLDAFISAMMQRIQEVEYAYDCMAKYSIPNVVTAGITNGRPPQAPSGPLTGTYSPPNGTGSASSAPSASGSQNGSQSARLRNCAGSLLLLSFLWVLVCIIIL